MLADEDIDLLDAQGPLDIEEAVEDDEGTAGEIADLGELALVKTVVQARGWRPSASLSGARSSRLGWQ